jgi:predicted transcriptional regulator
MQKEKQNKENKPGKERKEGYIVVPNYFLREWVKVLGVGPALLYLQLLSYCHKEKDIAWPTIDSLCQQMGIAKTTLLRYQNTLIKFGLIKNVTKSKSTTGHYKNNVYQIIPLEELSGHPDPDKIIDFVGSKMKPDWYQNDTCIGSNMKLSLVSKRYPNNTNLNITNITTTKRGKDAVAAVNFKKLKEEGEERMQAPYSSKEKEHYTGQALRERMVELDFKEGFVEKMLKEYSLKKIEEKLDLLLERKNIKSPAGWLK